MAILVDGVATATLTSPSIVIDALTINGSISFPQAGDWVVSCIIVWDTVLNNF